MEEGGEVTALDRQVNASAGLALVERARTERGGFQGVAYGKQGIAEGFRLQPAGILAPPQKVGRVAHLARLGPFSRLHVGSAGHDELVEGLQPPAVLNEGTGEKIEELGVRHVVDPGRL